MIFVGGVAAVADPCEDVDWPASLDCLGGGFGFAGFGSFHFVLLMVLIDPLFFVATGELCSRIPIPKRKRDVYMPIKM